MIGSAQYHDHSIPPGYVSLRKSIQFIPNMLRNVFIYLALISGAGLVISARKGSKGSQDVDRINSRTSSSSQAAKSRVSRANADNKIIAMCSSYHHASPK